MKLMTSFRKLLLLCATALILGACSKDEAIPLPDVSESHVYSGSKLKLRYASELMPAKEVTFIPADGVSAAKLECKGLTDLSLLSSLGLSGTGPAPGVIPGSPEISLPITLRDAGDYYAFQGSSQSDYVSSFNYSGKLQADSLVLNISDVKLRSEVLAGSVWVPVKLKREGAQILESPFHLVWELNPSSAIHVDLSQVLDLLSLVPIIPTYHDTAYSSIEQLYSSALQTVAFLENGNIVVRYYSSVGGATQLMTSVGNTLQYVAAGGSNLLLFPNPTTLAGRWLVAQSDPGDNPDISFRSDSEDGLQQDLLLILKGMIPGVLKMCTDGIPLTYQLSDNNLSIYVSTPVILGLLSQVVEAIEANPQILQGLLQKLGQVVPDQEVLAAIEELLPQLKQLLLDTTTVEIGLNFTRYTPA
ncbi:MAG: hypothetical protein J1E97_00165 [Muribaculaceae bacterium]|nr:hypothetical protein [Muribaculaceae bacterium]